MNRPISCHLLLCSSAVLTVAALSATSRLAAYQPPTQPPTAATDPASDAAAVPDDLQRPAILQRIAQILGPLPSPAEPAALDARVESDAVVDSLRRQRLRFRASGTRQLEADLLMPDDPQHPPLPGVVFVLDDPDDRISRQFAEHLARNDFVCLVPRWEPQALLSEERADLSEGVSQVMRSIDLLQSLPAVDRNRIGLIGNGIGGRLAPLIAALDKRIVATVARIEPRGGSRELSILHVSSDGNGRSTGSNEVGAAELFAAVAPRALMIRCSFTAADPQALQSALAEASPAFAATAVPDSLALVDIDLNKGNQSDAAGKLFQWLNHHLAAQGE